MRYKIRLEFTSKQTQFADVVVVAESKREAIDKAIAVHEKEAISESFMYDGEVQSLSLDIDEKQNFNVDVVEKLHPLLNPNSLHYQTQEYPTIWYIEQQLNVEEMIGACRFNAMKYSMREKGQDESDREKIVTYQSYIKFLQTLDTRERKDASVRTIIDSQRKDIVYSQKD
jgi:hypothetical protein